MATVPNPDKTYSLEEENERCIIQYGNLNKKDAEHIVMCHNKWLSQSMRREITEEEIQEAHEWEQLKIDQELMRKSDSSGCLLGIFGLVIIVMFLFIVFI